MGKSSGSAPAPTDPYQQAGAQYGLDTGTAAYNAALNRTNSSNPLGSNTWTQTGVDTGSPGSGAPGSGMFGYGGPINIPGIGSYNLPGGGYPSAGGGGGTGAPIYSQQTSLTPWANSLLESPIDTSGIAGMPGGPSTTGDLNNTRNALFAEQMNYLQPQEQLAGEQLDSQLANEGITPGSAAYNQAKEELGRQQTFTNSQAINSAITGGGAEQSRLFGLGSQSLQDQLAERNAPISEYEALQGNPSSAVSAATPDISGAFGQQYQGQLAGYNANVASNNATTSTVGSLALAAAMYF